MVGPGEVDDDLQPEVTEECSKFGKVINCLVFEVCVALARVSPWSLRTSDARACERWKTARALVP